MCVHFLVSLLNYVATEPGVGGAPHYHSKLASGGQFSSRWSGDGLGKSYIEGSLVFVDSILGHSNGTHLASLSPVGAPNWKTGRDETILAHTTLCGLGLQLTRGRGFQLSKQIDSMRKIAAALAWLWPTGAARPIGFVAPLFSCDHLYAGTTLSPESLKV